jgi:nucleoside-diphosphate-sugar epimerase
MTDLPKRIDTEDHLDELLSRPRPATVELFRRLEGEVLILGAGGKMGPSLTRCALRARDEAGSNAKIYAVARREIEPLRQAGAETIACDLLDDEAMGRLPDAANVLYLVGRKFGSTGSEPLTWAVNVLAAGRAARRFAGRRVVMFSTGCVYPVMDVSTGGATEQTPPEPIGEYAMSCLGRERMFDYASAELGTRVLQFRLNYAHELRYGVLVDVARRVRAGEPVDLTTGYVNVLWQGDACNVALLCLDRAESPPAVLNVTGPEVVSIREAAERFGEVLGLDVRFTGEENGRGYLSNAAKATGQFGPPTVPAETIVEWVADWTTRYGPMLDKPTHFETQDGRF